MGSGKQSICARARARAPGSSGARGCLIWIGRSDEASTGRCACADGGGERVAEVELSACHEASDTPCGSQVVGCLQHTTALCGSAASCTRAGGPAAPRLHGELAVVADRVLAVGVVGPQRVHRHAHPVHPLVACARAQRLSRAAYPTLSHNALFPILHTLSCAPQPRKPAAPAGTPYFLLSSGASSQPGRIRTARPPCQALSLPSENVRGRMAQGGAQGASDLGSRARTGRPPA
jgi:hypothetical protein